MNIIKGQLTISRARSSSDDGYVEIRFRDTDACCEFASFKLGPKEFADALFGLGYVPGIIDLRGLEIVGTKAENKTELIPCDLPYGDKKKIAHLKTLVRKLEVDGWSARESDIENSHNYRHKPDGVHVVFFRHVPKERHEK